MVQILGSVGLGLVVGWAAARLVYRASWRVWAWVLCGLAAHMLLVLKLAARPALISFVVALGLSMLACIVWVRGLERRYAARVGDRGPGIG